MGNSQSRTRFECDFCRSMHVIIENKNNKIIKKYSITGKKIQERNIINNDDYYTINDTKYCKECYELTKYEKKFFIYQ
jgi:hypothetical protein